MTNFEHFLQRLFCLHAETTEMLLDKSVIQNEIDIYNRIYERRNTIAEIIDEFKKLQNECNDTAALSIKFTGTTIL